MTILSSLNALADTYQLSVEQRTRLLGFATPIIDPAQQLRLLRRGAGITGAVLAGVGIICWIAANWHGQSRATNFVILQCLIVASCGGAFFRHGARPALGMAAFISIGALLAFFGQTYQAGGDAWQLFALWAGLAVPLCLGVRHDAVWTGWALVALSAVSLAMHQSLIEALRYRTFAPLSFLIAWGTPLLLVFLLGPPTRKLTGAGNWTVRSLVGLTTLMILEPALKGLFEGADEATWLAFILLIALGRLFCEQEWHDTTALCCIGLSLNVMTFALVAKLFDRHDVSFGALFAVLGITGAVMLTATVKFVMLQSQAHAQGAQQ